MHPPAKTFQLVGDQIVPTTLIGEVFVTDDGVPIEDRLERKAESLAESLLNDAKDVLADAIENPTFVDEAGVSHPKDVIAQKKYAASILGVVTKMVQGKQNINLKKKESARSEATFLMDLLKKAQSGQMTAEELDVLSPPKSNE